MPDLKLTDQQLSFIDTFGYLYLPGLIADVIEEVTEAFEALWTERGGGHHGQAHDGQRRSCIVPFIDQHPRLCALLDDERIHGLLTSLLGDDFTYTGSDGNYYAGDTRWHSDDYRQELRHVKIAFYLDPLTRDTGCLRVIPGSHRLADAYADELESNTRNSETAWGIDGSQVPAQALETQPGDIACFVHNTKHASFGGDARRRMFTINSCQRYPENRIDDLEKNIAAGARFWIDRTYGETMVQTAGAGRMVHLEQGLAHDGHLAELSRRARIEMSEPSRG